MYELCICCLQGRGTEASKEECHRLLKLATNEENADAAYSLAMELRNKKEEESFTLLKESAEKGHPKVAIELGQRYEEGRGVERDVKEATKYYRTSANSGDIDGMIGLMRCFSKGFESDQYERAEVSMRNRDSTWKNQRE